VSYVIAERADRDVGLHETRMLDHRFPADHAAPHAAREALEEGLAEIEGGARLTAALLARALVSICVRDEPGEVRVEVTIETEHVRVVVSGSGAGFRLPLSSRAIDYVSLTDRQARPLGWRSYLLERLADGWGVDEHAQVAWFEVDHVGARARRLQTSRRAAAYPAA
jgi:hypothetical protein